LNGVIDGPGGLRIGGSGLVTLSGANTYEGPTFVSGNLAIASDASLAQAAPASRLMEEIPHFA
jgi:autotransporter-associated beta strand protein